MTKHVVPRAIVGAVRADGAVNPTEVLAELGKQLDGFKTEQTKKFASLEKVVADFRAENDTALKSKADAVLSEKVERINGAIDESKAAVTAATTAITAIQAEIDKLVDKQAALTVNGSGSAKQDPRLANPHSAEYGKAFNTYFRKGENAVGGQHALRDLEVKAQMSIQSDPDGGYTVTPEIEQTIDSVVKLISPMRSLATIRPIGTLEYKKLVNQHGVNSGWVGETQSRPNTNTATLSELKFPVMEVYAEPAATQSLLDDSFTDIGAWLASEVELEFAQKEGTAFISGDGVNKPQGILAPTAIADASYAWGKVGFFATGTSGAFAASGPADVLVDAYHGLNGLYRQNSTWLMNRKTLGSVRKLKDGQGNYLLNMVLRQEAFVEEILGRPAVEMPDMPDLAANSLSIAIGDWKRGYVIVDRVGIRVLRDAYTQKPFVLFYTTKRVGGGVQNFEAYKLVKFG